MWSWLFEQPQVWMELVMGVIFTLLALYAEDWIDTYRNRKRRG